MFTGRTLLIASKHKKEQVLAPVLEALPGVKCLVATRLDTDLLGTFTGEVERSADPVATARIKCVKALELHGGDLAVASEGSFGPHPEIGFLPVNEEILFLLDQKHHLEIVVREISFDTNFSGSTIQSEEELRAFAERAGFPSHALVLRPEKNSAEGISKGITTWPLLLDTFHALYLRQKYAYAETDMRAMHNPTRMKVIQQAAQKLLQKASTACPHCHSPGFGEVSYKRGLPCGQCGFPSRTVRSATTTCQKCSHAEEVLYPDGQTVADPAHCQLCNP